MTVPQTIPASAIVSVQPGVLPAGGTGIALTGMFLSTSWRVPVGTVQRFATKSAVDAYYGPNSTESAYAAKYFAGFDDSNIKPGAMNFTQYNAAAVGAYLRGGNLTQLSIAQINALPSGSVSVVADGLTRAAPSVNLSGATSYSNVASLLQTALNASLPSAASVTGSVGGVVTASAGAAFTGTGASTNLTTTGTVGVLHPGAVISGTGVTAGTYIVSQTSGAAGGDGVYVTSAATTSSGDALTATSNILDVTAVASGSLQVGDVLSGSGVTTDTTILAQLSGTPSGIGIYTVDSAQHVASTTVTSLSTVLKVTAVGSGSLAVGSPLAGTNIVADSEVTALLTGSGGVGTYQINHATTTVSETITASAAALAVTFDSVSGALLIASGLTGVPSTMAFATGTLSPSLYLTSATGALVSQGADASVPGSFMDALVLVTQNWAGYTTTFDPDESGFANKLLFAEWTGLQNRRYYYACWDTDASPTAQNPATGSLGYAIQQAGIDGVALLWEDAAQFEYLAAFACGAIASIDFTELNGRITVDFKHQSGITPNVRQAQVAANLQANGYNYYGAYATGDTDFNFLANGQISGEFLWIDSYVNQIWLNSSFQNNLMTFLRAAKAVPYNPPGYARIAAACKSTIIAGLNFGMFSPGVDLSPSQIAEVNAAAGVDISQALFSQGYYFQVRPADAATRAARRSPPITFWYCDAGSVQQINLASIAIQ